MKKVLVLFLAVVLLVSFTFEAFAVSSYIVNTEVDPLNVHSEPSGGTATLIGKLRKGKKVQVYSIKGGWARIWYNGGWAYVYSEYLKLENGETPIIDDYKLEYMLKETPSIDGTMIYKATSKVNIRKESNIHSEPLGTIQPGEEVYAVKETKNWLKIVFKKGFAYVKKEFFEKVAPNLPSDGKLYCVSVGDNQKLNVRVGPSTKHEIITQIRNGSYVRLIEYSSELNWAKVYYGKGKSGYVQLEYLDRILE